MGVPLGNGHSLEFGGVAAVLPKGCNYLLHYKSNDISSLQKFHALLRVPLPPLFFYFKTKANTEFPSRACSPNGSKKAVSRVKH